MCDLDRAKLLVETLYCPIVNWIGMNG